MTLIIGKHLATLKGLSYLRWIAVCSLIILLTACGGSVKDSPGQVIKGGRQPHANPEVEAQITRLESASILTQQNKHQESLILMQGLQANLLPVAYHWQALQIGATNGLALEEGWQALHFLNLFSSQLTKMTKAQGYQIAGYRADAYLLIGYLPQALQQRHLQARFASNKKELQASYTALWQNLRLINNEQLNLLAAQEKNALLLGWIELALTSQTAAEHPDIFIQSLNNWHARWPNHPAQEYMPQEISLLQQLSQQQVQHLGVFLPESGPLAEAAQVLKDALVTSQLANLQAGFPTPKLSFYATQKGRSLMQLYQQAQADGVEVIIGPFAKEDVIELEKLSSLPLPTLALNYGNTSSFNNKDMFQFGLSSENEAEEVALKAWQSGYRRALTLTSANAWGNRVQSSFIQAWKKLGGEITDSREYGGTLSLDQSLRALLEVELSQQRHQRLTRLLGIRPHFVPRPREDSDFLFLHADPSTARQVKPALRFLMAGNLPVMATSAIYTGTNNPNQDKDLNGILFCDIPWYLNKNSALETQLRQTWPNSMLRYGRIYAMGTDAYLLAQRLPLLDALPESRLEGATGRLSQVNRKIKRELDWAYFNKGKIEPLNNQNLDIPSLIKQLEAD